MNDDGLSGAQHGELHRIAEPIESQLALQLVRVPDGGSIDRDQYSITALWQPNKPWTAWAPQNQFNHRMVITHGEPDAGNVLKTPAGLVLVDWESALLAPPERDLWALAESDPGLLDAYTAATGTGIDTDALALYRMWYDLAEISCYVRWFRSSHDDTADAAEGWQNLQYFLRPAQRWPDLLARPAGGST